MAAINVEFDPSYTFFNLVKIKLHFSNLELFKKLSSAGMKYIIHNFSTETHTEQCK